MQAPPLTPDEPARLAALRATLQLETPVEERFEVITRIARRLLDVPIAAISLVDADYQWFKSINGLDVDSTSRDVSFCGHTILDDHVMVIPDAREDPRFADNPLVTGPPNIVFYAGCPVRSNCGQNIASVCVIDHKPRRLSDDDLACLRDLASMAQQQLELTVQQTVQMDLIQQLEAEKRKAMIDPLTRLWNRAGLDELLARQIAECQQAEEGIAVIVADLDRFKKVNDEHGHLVGDEVLREVARRLLAGARHCDCVGRFGGEEFLIVLGGCETHDLATRAARRLCERVHERPIQTEARDITVTASFGVHHVAAPVEVSSTQLIEKADAALYRAKAAGRDCVRSTADGKAAA